MEITVNIPDDVVDHIADVCQDLGIDVDDWHFQQAVIEFLKQDVVSIYDTYYTDEMGDAIIQFWNLGGNNDNV